jgi:CheY-like chemotaxis protein
VPNILIADDVASNLIALDFQLSVLKGPDNKRQICDKTADGNQLVDQYISRLEESIKSNWELMPYQIIITDAQMPFLNGPEAVK